jgi:hypothetical protein
MRSRAIRAALQPPPTSVRRGTSSEKEQASSSAGDANPTTRASRGACLARDPNIIRRMVRQGRAGELHRVLLSISAYSKGESKPEVPASAANDSYLVTLVIHHVEFVSRHGTDLSEAWNGKYTERGHPEKLERWLSLGMPHHCRAAVEAYLRDDPSPPRPPVGKPRTGNYRPGGNGP